MTAPQQAAASPLAAVGTGASLRDAAIGGASRLAIADADTALDRCTLAHLTAACAARLHRSGVRPGDRVAVLASKRVDAVCWLLGALRAGAVVVPLNPRLRERQHAAILADCAPAALVWSDARFTIPDGLLAGTGARVLIGPDDAAALLEHPVDRARATAAHLHDGLVDDTPAALLYTSGSTGTPKGILLSHSNLAHGAASVATYLGLTERDRVLALPPLSFDYGLSQLTSALRVGASVVLADYRLPQSVFALIERHHITGLPGVPTLWDRLAALDWPAAARGLRYATNTGGALPPRTVRALLETLPDTELHLMYGFTEAFRATSLPPVLARTRPDSVGRAVPYAEVRIVRPDGSECAANEPGELVQHGQLVALGYHGDPVATAERWRPLARGAAGVEGERWAWSGDVAVRDGDGLISFVSRRDDMVKLSGHRTYPAEIERELRDGAPVVEACVSCPEHPKLGTVAVADVVLAPDAAVDDVLDWCRAALPSYHVPHRVQDHAALPTGPNGKLDRAALRAAWEERFAAAPDAHE